MKYLISDISRILNLDTAPVHESTIEYLLTDSRRLQLPAVTLFFALEGPRREGLQFIPGLYQKGVRNFVVGQPLDKDRFPEANFLEVTDCLVALQDLAAYHRSRFTIPVIGITGSNGKTIVKEWLYQLLHEDFHIVRSPKSYNSQTGVALSIWQMNESHTLALFEAGISEQEEMPRLQKMIRPTLGILTNIGEAHSAGFIDDEHKLREKLTLFRNSPVLIGREKDFYYRNDVRDLVEMLGVGQLLTWGGPETDNEFVVEQIEKQEHITHFKIGQQPVTIPFTDDASIENAITCYCVLLELKIDPVVIAQRMQRLQPVNMRLELKKGVNECLVINDSYSADINSLDIALNFLEQQATTSKRTVILSDFLQSSMPDHELYQYILSALENKKITRLIGIGERIAAACQNNELTSEGMIIELHPSTQDFLHQFRSSHFKEEIILVKGARVFAFEQIVQLLEQKAHQTVLEIDLNAIVHNLKAFQQVLKPTTKVMAMVKAFAYGSGGAEIAGILQYHNIDYLGVAYADEGVELRNAGISLPVMVMNPEQSTFESIVKYNLEPEIYSFGLLDAFQNFLEQEALDQYHIHIEVETGMNRLGFAVIDMELLGARIRSSSFFKVQSVFSHLAGSEEPGQDEYTREQFYKFEQASEKLQELIGYPVIRHIANSAAITRHPSLQMDMVRLGIGLYGVDSAGSGKLNLQTVATLRSTVAQVKNLTAGESVSYNRQTIVRKDSVIATIRIGYADGYPRRLGNGVGKIWVRGMLAPVIGTVCMDMIMIDVTDIPGVKEGDGVIVFGNELRVEQVAKWAGTIPYEIMTGISQRVKRVYFEE